jgi:hypothetical protein
MKISSLSPFLAVLSATTFSSANGVDLNGVDLNRGVVVQRARMLAELSAECEAAHEALADDDAFNATATTYYDNWGEIIVSLDLDDPDVCTTGDTSIDCVIADNVGGTDEFRTACEEKSGTFYGASMDFRCTITSEGETVDFSNDFPPIYYCIPVECDVDSVAKTFDEVQNEVVELYDVIFDLVFGPDGGADCQAGVSTSAGATASVLHSLIMGGLLGIAFVFSS